MAKEKNLELSYPALTYCAVIAGTLHSYWSNASDPIIKASAKKNLHICQTFAEDWGPRWPICRFFVSYATFK